ncbi:MAG: hypothetical protein WA063_00405 [Minisyncoccia bacterium]
MLKKVDKSGYPKHLVELVASYKLTSQTICDFGEGDMFDTFAEDWKKIRNALDEREKKILDELLSSPDYEEASDTIYDLAETIAVKLYKSGFSHKQVRKYIKNRFNVKITDEDIIWLHNISKDVSNLKFIDLNNYRDIEPLTEKEIKEVIEKVGIPRGEK